MIKYDKRENYALQIALLLSGDIATNPGPIQTRTSNTQYQKDIRCLYLNARSIVNKSGELQTIATGYDIIAITETWLKPDTLDCKILPGNEFIICRKDIVGKTGGGVMLAVRANIPSFRQTDIESDAEILVCKICPKSRKKLLIAVFYRPPNSSLQYIKQFKNFLTD